ncbi:MAG: hypothetical protein ABFD92_04675 [Planctomycetaceae bacterium]|nr:hypothetical protein [Planctomycetaceae bacterium]
MKRLALCILLLTAGAALAGDDITAGTVLPSQWRYSTDGGQTYSRTAPTITGMHAPDPNRRDAAKCEFTIDDPGKIGLLKIRCVNPAGSFALSNAESVDRYNVGSSPTLLETRIVLNGKKTKLDHDENTLYRYLRVEAGDLKKGVNTLELAGNFWHKNYPAGAVACDLELETIPPDRAVLDRLPVLGMIGEDYFGLACRAIIPSQFTIAVTPTDPPGPTVTQTLGPFIQLKAKAPLPKGTRAFKYSVTVSAGGASKQYGPYEARTPKTGVGFRFMLGGGTMIYGHHPQEFEAFMAKVRQVSPDVFIHTGNYQNCPNVDAMWTSDFFRITQPTFASIPLFATVNITEMMSPATFSRSFYFPPDDADWANWTVAVGNVRFVAVETFGQSHDSSGAGLKWLEDVLKDAKEDYVLVLNSHVTGCSPTSFTRWYEDGTKYTAEKIDPLLVKYNVTAAIGNIHRCYQRVVPPAGKGVPTIITGKAGGLGWPLRTKEVEGSKAISGANHYVLFEVKRDHLEMKAVDLDGKLIDTCTLKPRK